MCPCESSIFIFRTLTPISRLKLSLPKFKWFCQCENKYTHMDTPYHQRARVEMLQLSHSLFRLFRLFSNSSSLYHSLFPTNSISLALIAPLFHCTLGIHAKMEFRSRFDMYVQLIEWFIMISPNMHALILNSFHRSQSRYDPIAFRSNKYKRAWWTCHSYLVTMPFNHIFTWRYDRPSICVMQNS